MPCKTPVNSRGETCRSFEKRKTKYACTVDADESVRIRMEGAVHKHHEDHITAKGMNSLNLVHKVHSDASSIKNTESKGSSGKIMGKIGENSGMAADESQKQERCDR